MVIKTIRVSGGRLTAKVVSIEPQMFVELEIAETDPGFKGDTVQGGTKPATLETGAVVVQQDEAGPAVAARGAGRDQQIGAHALVARNIIFHQLADIPFPLLGFEHGHPGRDAAPDLQRPRHQQQK